MKTRVAILFILMAMPSTSFAAIKIKTSDFQKWLTKTTNYLDTNGTIVNTSMGPVQVVMKGKGPPILVLHGGFGGWDQGLDIASTLPNYGFQIIVPSRPGYLGTPIYTDPLIETTPQQQADLMAALVAALGLSKVVALGFSAGAPVAYEFGLNYPNLTNAVVLECIGANPAEDGLFYGILGLILATQTQEIDYNCYLMSLSVNSDFYSSALEILPLDTTLAGADLAARNSFVVNHIDQYAFLRYMIQSTIPLSPRLFGTLNDFLGVDFWTTTFMPPIPLSQYSLPTLIIQAVDDSNGYYPTAQIVNQGLPTSQLFSVPNSGHFIWLGPDTNTWQQQIIQFLKANTQ